MRNAVLLAATAAFALAAPVAAAAADAPQPLSFAEATTIALRQNPAYLASGAQVDAAAARAQAARGVRGPSATLSDSYQFADPVARLQTPFGALPFSPNATNVPLATVSTTLFDGGAAAAQIAEAQAHLAAAQDARRAAATATIGYVAAAYYDLAAASGEADVAQGGIAVAADHVRLVEERLRAGTAARADLLQAQTRLADARVRAIDADAGVDRAGNALDAVLGVPFDRRYRPADALDAPVPELALGTLLTSARATRGELAAARDAIAAAHSVLDAAKAARSPRVGVAASEGNVQPAVESGFHSQFALALNAVWTIFDRGVTAGNVAAAQAEVRRAELEVERLATSVELDVRQADADLRAARQCVAAARALNEFSAENERLAEVRYRGGVGTVLELSDAELADRNARQTLVSAEAGLQRSYAALRVAAGLQ